MSFWPGMAATDNRLTRFIRRIREDDALNALMRYKNRQISETAMCAVCWPYIGRIADEVSRRFSHGNVDRDDLQSELWLIFVEKVIMVYSKDKGPLSPYVMRYADNICRNMLKHGKRMEYHDHEDVIDHFGNSVEHSFTMDDEGLDRKRALEKISKRLATNGITGYDALMNKKIPVPGFTQPALETEAARERASVPLKKKVTSELASSCKDVHKELRSIRHSLGYSQAMMADCLGIGVPRYASYEYGRTSGVPDEIMDAARAELNLDNDEVSQLKARFSISMGDLVRRWMGMVGEDCDYKKLSAICGVSLSTVHRWAENKTRPSLAILNRYENMVIEWVGIMRRKEGV